MGFGAWLDMGVEEKGGDNCEVQTGWVESGSVNPGREHVGGGWVGGEQRGVSGVDLDIDLEVFKVMHMTSPGECCHMALVPRKELWGWRRCEEE